jgi:phage shock protein C
MSRKKGELYRDSTRGKIAGVCAGLSDYFGIELWLVRIIFISAVLLSGGPFFIVAYIACWFILDNKSKIKPQFGTFNDSQTEKPIEVKSKVWQAGEPPRRALHDLKDQFDRIDIRLQAMEKYVTSTEFTINSEIKKL